MATKLGIRNTEFEGQDVVELSMVIKEGTLNIFLNKEQVEDLITELYSSRDYLSDLNYANFQSLIASKDYSNVGEEDGR